MPLHKQQHGDISKPTLIFLHGFLGSSNDWHETIALLKDDFHCITIDLPGHGSSVTTANSRSNGFDHCHQLITNILDDLSIKQYTLIGYSLGGRIALDYARTQNDPRLTALLLESSHTGLLDEQAKERRFIHDHSWAKKFATQHIIDTLDEWYDQDVFSDLSEREKEIIINQRSDNYGVPVANTLLATSLGKQINALPYLQQTDLKIHYCFGEKDKKFKDVSAQLNNLAHVNCVQFDQAGHNIHQYYAPQFAQFILQNLTHS